MQQLSTISSSIDASRALFYNALSMQQIFNDQIKLSHLVKQKIQNDNYKQAAQQLQQFLLEKKALWEKINATIAKVNDESEEDVISYQLASNKMVDMIGDPSLDSLEQLLAGQNIDLYDPQKHVPMHSVEFKDGKVQWTCSTLSGGSHASAKLSAVLHLAAECFGVNPDATKNMYTKMPTEEIFALTTRAEDFYVHNGYAYGGLKFADKNVSKAHDCSSIISTVQLPDGERFTTRDLSAILGGKDSEYYESIPLNSISPGDVVFIRKANGPLSGHVGLAVQKFDKDSEAVLIISVNRDYGPDYQNLNGINGFGYALIDMNSFKQGGREVYGFRSKDSNNPKKTLESFYKSVWDYFGIASEVFEKSAQKIDQALQENYVLDQLHGLVMELAGQQLCT